MPAPQTAKPQIAVIVGSNRRESINRRLAQALIKLGAGKFDAKIVRIDDLPIYNQDNEGNLPAEVVRFKDEIKKADGVLIVTPEHNRSAPTVLKNAIDWGARPYGTSVWPDKPGFITGTSPGAIGTALVQANLRTVLLGLGMTLLGGESYVQFKPNLVDDQGNVTDESTKKFLQSFVDRFATLVERLAPAERRAAA
jgi:chromate reductase, NAD(P)H dehydrogenase (quinone)